MTDPLSILSTHITNDEPIVVSGHSVPSDHSASFFVGSDEQDQNFSKISSGSGTLTPACVTGSLSTIDYWHNTELLKQLVAKLTAASSFPNHKLWTTTDKVLNSDKPVISSQQGKLTVLPIVAGEQSAANMTASTAIATHPAFDASSRSYNIQDDSFEGNYPI